MNSLLAAIVCLTTAACTAFAASPVEVRLSHGSREDSVVVTLTNHSGEDIYYLKSSLPEQGRLTTDYFRVVDHEGARQQYVGVYVERPLPERADYALLRAGASVSCVVAVADFYALSGKPPYIVSAPDNFVAYYRASAFDPDGAGKWAAFVGSVTVKSRPPS